MRDGAERSYINLIEPGQSASLGESLQTHICRDDLVSPWREKLGDNNASLEIGW